MPYIVRFIDDYGMLIVFQSFPMLSRLMLEAPDHGPTEQFVYILSDAIADREGTSINELDIKNRVVERSLSFVNAERICFLHLALLYHRTREVSMHQIFLQFLVAEATVLPATRPADADYGEL